MPEQLSLPGIDATAPPFKLTDLAGPAEPPQEYALFLGLFPQPDDALRIAGVAADLRSQHGLAGAVLEPQRLHITLHGIAGFTDVVPQSVIDAARVAVANVACPPLPIAFDQVMSFTGSQAFVLLCDAASDAAIARLRNSLTLPLRRVGLRPRPSGKPHMTMLYAPRRRIASAAIEPVRWMATRYALVLSHVGMTHHQWVGEWPLDSLV